MIDHLGISVSDHARSKAFYLAALAPLGIGVALGTRKQVDDGAFVIDLNGVNLEAVCHAPA